MHSGSTVVLFSIDGLRPDALAMADTPTIDALMAQGTFTLNARTVMPSVTLPCHTSMLRGVDTARHGITTNTFQPLARPVPSVIDVAHAHHCRTGFFFNWPELRDLCAPGSLNVAHSFSPCYDPESDWLVARAAAREMRRDPFDFLFVYLGYTDECGHAHGWMSPPYLQAVANADRCIAHVLEACKAPGRQTTVLIQSDHGGHDRSHGTDLPEDMTIPWILSGARVRAGKVLDTPVRIYDTCSTLAALLGLPLAREWEGRVVEEALILNGSLP